MTKYESVFSEFEIKNASIKFADSETFTKLGCVGSADDELEVKVVTKSCEGVVVKSVARGAGSGTLNMSLHMNYSLYVEALGMEQEGLKTGVVAYGKNSKHKEFSLVAEIFDEDGVKKLVAYPRCVMSSAPSATIENGAEEVAEIEIEMNLFADDLGNCKYEAIAESLSEDLNSQWMTNWSQELIKNA